MIRWLTFFLFLCAATANAEVRGTPGFWHLEKDRDGFWWFRSPEGRRVFVHGVTSVQPFQTSRKANGPAYRSKHFDGTNWDVWAAATAKELKGMGFNAVGAWSAPQMGRHLPYTEDLNVHASTTSPIGTPAWEAEVERVVARQVAPLVGDKNLIGYYLDNELPWFWDAALSHNADRYFEVVCRAVRRHDPNHLVLGVRHNRMPPENVLAAARGRIDVESVNDYSLDGRLWKAVAGATRKGNGPPVIVSEFSFYSPINRSGNRNVAAWWPPARDQKERAAQYEKFVTEAARCPEVIGTEFFAHHDEPPDGRTKDGEDINVGVVDLHDVPYEPLTDVTRKLDKTIPALRDKAGGDVTDLAPIE